jgi:hypothetical protein
MKCLEAVGQIGLIQDICEESDGLQDDICEIWNWPRPDDFHEIASDLKGSAFARHRDAMKLRRKYADVWTEEREEYISEITQFIGDHPPILVEDQQLDPAVLAETLFLRKSYEMAIAIITHYTMGGTEPVGHSALFPPGIGPKTQAVLLEALSDSLWCDPGRLLFLDEA